MKRLLLAAAVTISILGIEVPAVASGDMSTEEWLAVTRPTLERDIYWFDHAKLVLDYGNGTIHAMATNRSAGSARESLRAAVEASFNNDTIWADLTSDGFTLIEPDKEIDNNPVIVENYGEAYIASQTFYLVHEHMDNRKSRYEDRIRAAALRHDIDPDFLVEFIEVTTAFNPRAVSAEGAMGLMLVDSSRFGIDAMIGTGRSAMYPRDKELLDPETNLDLGAWYFSKLLNRYSNIEDQYARYYVALSVYLHAGAAEEVIRTLKPNAGVKSNALMFRMLPLSSTINNAAKGIKQRMNRYGWN